MADLTAEWCREQADECDVDAKWARNANQDAGADYAENLGHALRIAAAVLDEEAAKRMVAILAAHFASRPLESLAKHKADLRVKIMDGYDINEPTLADIEETAQAVLSYLRELK